MRQGQCPKCASQRVHVSNVRLPLQGWTLFNAIAITDSFWWGSSTAILRHYVCVSCGYVEQYVTDTDKLLEIAARWPQVSSTKG
jgi:predicted nucleic-acid-binding Zn-ribbon protein